MRAAGSRASLVLLVLLLGACSPSLPDPDSREAKLYVARCGVCHRIYAPHLLTAEMWKLQVARMQEEMTRRGMRPLDAEERTAIMSYLTAHAG